MSQPHRSSPPLVENKPDTGVREFLGRTFQNKNDIYVLPADGPEMERLTQQHRKVTLAMNTLCWPDEDVRQTLSPREGAQIRVLDIGSGSGVWAAEMAKAYAHVDILGIDLAPMRPSDAPANARYEYMDAVNDDMSHLFGIFDLVHCRFIDVGVREFKSFTHKIISLVKPGGLLVLISGDMDLADEDKNIVKRADAAQDPDSGASWLARIIGEYQDRVVRCVEYPPSIGTSIPGWVAKDGRLTGMKVFKQYYPIGWPGVEDPNLQNKEEVNRLTKDNCLAAIVAMGPGLIAAGVPEEQVDTWLQDARAEIEGGHMRVYMQAHFCAAHARLFPDTPM